MIEDGDDDFSIEETQVDMKDFNFDILLINAEINFSFFHKNQSI